jgi:glutaredoxin
MARLGSTLALLEVVTEPIDSTPAPDSDSATLEASENARLKSHAVVVYHTRWCGYCHAAFALLDQEGIPYASVDVGGRAEYRRWLAERTRQFTVPQTFLHGEPIGGYEELLSLHQSGELERRLVAPSSGFEV